MTGMGEQPFRSGFVSLIGRPNSGKSTLLNTVLGQELAPVTPLPQTTRRNLRGVYTEESLQIVFIDTPGIHKGKHGINRVMEREAQDALKEAHPDCVCYLVDLSREFGDEEKLVAALVQGAGAPVLLVFNKVDQCKEHEVHIGRFTKLFPAFAATPLIAISAINRSAKKAFLNGVAPFIKEGPLYFDNETITDASMRFFAAEFLRKHVILNTREEVPHAVFVEIENYRESESRHDINVAIHVETNGQKGILIGNKGFMIGKIRSGAEKELSRLAGCPVHLSCHVKVTPDWRDNKRFLQDNFSA
jgi:GTP-binding protein Era